MRKWTAEDLHSVISEGEVMVAFCVSAVLEEMSLSSTMREVLFTSNTCPHTDIFLEMHTHTHIRHMHTHTHTLHTSYPHRQTHTET